MNEEKNVSRREVLKQGSVAAAFALSMPASVANAMQAAKDPKAAAADAARDARTAPTVRIAWIGSGTQGRNDLSKLVKIPGVEIVAIADIRDDCIAEALKLAPNAKVFYDYRKMLERKDIDGVGIATPLYLHAPMTIDALEAGKNVYCEKMMAYTVDDAKRMVRTAERTGKILQIGHQRRYSVDYHHAYDLVANKGYFGQITHVRAQWNRRNNWRRPLPKDPITTNGVKVKDPDKLANWRLYKAFSRGLMAELGSHQIDVTNWYLGGNSAWVASEGKKPAGRVNDLHPVAVVGIGGIDYWKEREVFDNVQVIFEYPGGQKLAYQSIEMNQFDGYAEEFMGRNGTLVTSEDKNTGNLMFREPGVPEFGFEKFSQGKTSVGGKDAIKLDAGATTSQDKRGNTSGQKLAGGSAAGKDNWHLSLEDWVDCIRTNRKPFCDGRVGLADVVCVIAANEAMEKGIRVRIPEDAFHV
jgi:predicted dehydrogenase